MTNDPVIASYEKLKSSFLRDLEELVRIPSVSFPGFDHAPMAQAAEAVKELLQRRGFPNAEVINFPNAHPYVYAERIVSPDKPTILLYAHYDVQPAGDESAWKSPPFEPTIRDGRLYGRGSTDDKAGIITHTSAVASFLDANEELPVNLKVLIEGEEEVSSASFEAFLTAYQSRLHCDAVVITDASNFETGLPSITTSLRGLAIVDVEVSSLRQSVHSGSWGGPMPDPVMGLCRMLASLTKPDGSIAIPGIAKKVRPLTAVERKSIESLPGSVQHFRSQAGMLPGVQLMGGKRHPWETIWRQPSLTVNAIQASSKKDARNIVCDSAWCRVGLRLVPDLDPKFAQAALVKALKASVPWGLKLNLKPHSAPAHPWYSNPSSAMYQAAFRALERGYGKKPVATGAGGSIPLVSLISKALGGPKGLPTLLMGIEDPYGNAHSENESQDLGDLERATLSAIHLYREFAALGRDGVKAAAPPPAARRKPAPKAKKARRRR